MHQLWIVHQDRRPQNMMDTWKTLHPEWERIEWDEKEIEKRGMTFECQQQIEHCIEPNGRADIMRWEILYQYGGVFLDADSICLEPLEPEIFLSAPFSCFENEQNRPGLVACGAMGFPPRHPLLRDIIDHIKTLDLHPSRCKLKAWYSVAVGLLTRMLDTGKYPDVIVYPSYMFIPHHFTGVKYQGHKKIYAYQAWGSTYQNYKQLNNIPIPPEMLDPPHYVSVLISSYNTARKYIHECLESIRTQVGHFGIELVWMNDGSDAEHTAELKQELEWFEKSSRFCRVIYKETAENRGIAATLHDGVLTCTQELIFKMDSDDIMDKNRIMAQLQFMERTPDCVCCGANIRMFRETADGAKTPLQTTNHPAVISWEQYRRNPSPWFLNHPTMCVRRAAILEVGNYNQSLTKSPFEDFELELRLLKRYGKIYNISDVLLNYRLHDGQITHQMNKSPEKWGGLREQIIRSMCGAPEPMKMNF